MTYHDDDTLLSDTNQRADGSRQGVARPRLLHAVRSRLRLKHDSLKTERAYVYWIRWYIHANGRRHPRELDGVAVERFLSLLAARDHVAASTKNQALSALLFLYREMLGIALPWMERWCAPSGPDACRWCCRKARLRRCCGSCPESRR